MRLIVAGVGLAPALLLAGCRPTPWTAELVSESAGGSGGLRELRLRRRRPEP